MFFFYGWILFHCVYVPYLNPFICPWTFRLFPSSRLSIVNSSVQHPPSTGCYLLRVQCFYISSSDLVNVFVVYIALFWESIDWMITHIHWERCSQMPKRPAFSQKWEIIWFLMKDTQIRVDLIPITEKFTISLKEMM